MFHLEPKNQEEIVKNDLLKEPQLIKDRLDLPGLKEMHKGSVNDLAQIIAMVLKSRSNIVKLEYVVGDYIEITLAV